MLVHVHRLKNSKKLHDFVATNAFGVLTASRRLSNCLVHFVCCPRQYLTFPAKTVTVFKVTGDPV